MKLKIGDGVNKFSGLNYIGDHNIKPIIGLTAFNVLIFIGNLVSLFI